MVGKINGLRKFLSYNMRKSNDKTTFFENFNRDYYSTDGYDDYLTRFKREGREYALGLVSKLKPTPSWRFLDVGCGMGGIVLALRELNFEAWGTEISPFCLKFSPAKRWMRFGDVCSLPFPHNSFEVVTCIDVLCYLNRKKTRQAIKELARVAKRYLFIESICKGSLNSNQKLNPDPLRKDKYLLTEIDFKNLLAENRAFFLKPLYYQKSVDFNGIFVK